MIQDFNPLNTNGVDAFLAFPMASLSEQEYKIQKLEADSVELYLKQYCRLESVYNPGANLSSQRQFDTPEESLRRAFAAIQSCRLFVMLYTSDKPSSVLVEAGYALAKAVPALYFLRKPLSLPFLLRAAAMTVQGVHVFEYDHIEEVLQVIKRDEFLPINVSSSESQLQGRQIRISKLAQRSN